jgi:hypothetical protein
MKIIITESQYKLLLEATEGLDEFLETLKNELKLSDELIDEVKSIFEKTDCKKVSFENLSGPMGLALHNKLVINIIVLDTKYMSIYGRNAITQTLFIIFHELAHQYQFKKYGEEKMMGLYLNEIPLDEAAESMAKYEAVADEFAIRKVRELQQKKLLPMDVKARKGYGNYPSPQIFKGMLEKIRTELTRSGVDNIDKAAEYIYNMVKPR